MVNLIDKIEKIQRKSSQQQPFARGTEENSRTEET